jgi:hypothetical protein
MLRLVLCLLFVLACGLRADEKPPPVPKAPPYSPGTAQIEGENRVCKMITTRYEAVKELFQVIEAEMVVNKTRIVYRSVQIEERAVHPLKDVKGHLVRPKGGDPTKAVQPLDITKLPEALKKGTPVIFIRAGESLEPSDLKSLKDGTIVLTLPKPELPKK